MIWLLSKVWPIAIFASLLINEISYKGTPEWVEIYNDSAETQSLENLILKDGNNSTKDDLYLTGTITGYEYKVFENNKSWLNDTGDSLVLISSISGQIFDEVGFEKGEDGKTYGRSEGKFVFMNPTKGQANSGAITPLPTKAPTTTNTPKPTPTPTPTPTTAATITRAPDIATAKITPVSSPSPILEDTTTEFIESTDVSSSSGEVLGDNDDIATPSGETPPVKVDNNFQKYGYLLMLLGTVMSTAGVGLGYMRYLRDGVK